MSIYSVNFSNETPGKWIMCVYQKLPRSPELDSVSWKQITVPPQGQSGIQWSTQYLACLASYEENGEEGVYSVSQKLNTDLGKKWKCVF